MIQPARADRRRLLVQGVRLGVGAIVARHAALEAAVEEALPPRTAEVRQAVSPGRTLPMFLALPARAHGRQAAVLVAGEAPLLDDRTRDLARRVAQLGVAACAPDWPDRGGGLDQIVLDALGTVQWLGRNPPGRRVLTGRVAAIGVGWGGTLVRALAVQAGPALAAVVTDAAMVPETPLATPRLTIDAAAPLSDPVTWARVAAFLQEHLR